MFKKINKNCVTNLGTILITGLCYTLLAISVAVFLYSITTTFIMQPPTTWTDTTGLPGIGDLYYPALFMYLHIISGCIIMIAGLIQIFPVIRRPNLLWIHKILGNVIFIFCLSTALFGNLYIFTSGTVGGVNMDIAFSVAGIVLASFATVTYIMAKIGKIRVHKEWALRTWAQIYASLFYRICYFTLFVFGYSVDSTSDFYRPLDEILDWFFFLFPMFCMEVYIQTSKYIKYRREKTSYNRLAIDVFEK